MLNLRILLASLFLCAGSALLAQEPTPVTCTDDIKTVTTQVGKEVVFCGTPSTVKAVTKDDGSNRLYMDFGGAYPENTFSVTISGKVSGAEHEKLKERFEGKEVMVKGTVEVYKDKPQINVQRMEDIRVK
ncbi:MAG: hypothetical protein ABI432_17020 [Flavobacteriales bacterium]